MSACDYTMNRGRQAGRKATGTHTGWAAHERAGEPPCEPCRLGHNEYKRELRRTSVAYRENTPARSRRYNLAHRYGMSADDYEERLAAQGGRCAICRTADPGWASFAVDHDHACCSGTRSCGRCVRGLLCRACNQALGSFGDNPERFEAAASYLRQAIR